MHCPHTYLCCADGLVLVNVNFLVPCAIVQKNVLKYAYIHLNSINLILCLDFFFY